MSFKLSLDEMDSIYWNDLQAFVERTFSELRPETKYSDRPHIAILCSKLTECINGGSKRLIINLPPRSLKSIIVSVALVAWVLGRKPSELILCASYGQDLADKHGRDTRSIMSSNFYRRVFPGTRLSPSKQAVNDFDTTRGGGRMATSVGGVVTGRGANILIIDDPQKPDEALSDTRRKAANSWLDNTALSRLDNKETGIIIIVMQRLHQDDLVGHVLEQSNWDVISFPAIAEQDEIHTAQTPYGLFRFERKKGEVLDPTRESLQTLLDMKQSIGSYNFESQYQQNPMSLEGMMVRRDWLRYYNHLAPLPRFTIKIQSWDTANKSGELNDFSVGTTWGLYNGNFYLLDEFRKKVIYPELKRAVVEQMNKHNPNIILIEDKASGTQLIQDLRADGVHRVKPYEAPPQTDKIMRFNAQTALFEAGKVLLPTEAPWLADYIREITGFPGTKFDDQVDSTTQALEYLSTTGRDLDIWARLGAQS